MIQQTFQQFIYNAPNSSKNFPLALTADSLITGDFLPKNKTISQIGISSLPGTKFYLNGGAVPVVVGFTGFFEIDLSAGGAITKITIDEASIRAIERNDSAFIVINIAYWGN